MLSAGCERKRRHWARFARRSAREATKGDELILADRNRAVRRLLTRTGLDPALTRVLDVGCGTGNVLSYLVTLGFPPQNLTGIELIPERAAAARRLLRPEILIRCGDASEGSLPDSDLVLLFTVFSSILNSSYRLRLAQNVWHALKPGGGILCYDFCFDNPDNPDVRSVPVREIRTLFPEACLTFERLTLAPPLARALPGLYPMLNTLQFLRTHALCWLKKDPIV